MSMSQYRSVICALCAIALSACASQGASNSSKSSHTYAFGKPSTTTSLTPVIVQRPASRQGPADVATLVYFDYDSDLLRPSDRSIVQAHAQWLRQNPEQTVVLRGHTDVRGGSEYNLGLGQRRAHTVAQTLQLLGVSAQQLEAVSYGKEQLADEATSEAAHQRNRRVEFDYR